MTVTSEALIRRVESLTAHVAPELAAEIRRSPGHADAGFTLRVYAREVREEGAVIDDVLSRAGGGRGRESAFSRP